MTPLSSAGTRSQKAKEKPEANTGHGHWPCPVQCACDGEKHLPSSTGASPNASSSVPNRLREAARGGRHCAARADHSLSVVTDRPGYGVNEPPTTSRNHSAQEDERQRGEQRGGDERPRQPGGNPTRGDAGDAGGEENRLAAADLSELLPTPSHATPEGLRDGTDHRLNGARKRRGRDRPGCRGRPERVKQFAVRQEVGDGRLDAFANGVASATTAGIASLSLSRMWSRRSSCSESCLRGWTLFRVSAARVLSSEWVKETKVCGTTCRPEIGANGRSWSSGKPKRSARGFAEKGVPVVVVLAAKLRDPRG